MRIACRLLLVTLLSPLAACRAEVVAGLDESEANHALVALDRAGLVPSKGADPGAEGRFRIDVDPSDVSSAIAVLQDEEIPGPAPLAATARPSPLLVGRREETAQLLATRSAELERTLGGLHGVASARVHISVADPPFLDDKPLPPPSAAVLLRTRNGASIDEAAVQRLIAASISGLEPERVTVVQTPRGAQRLDTSTTANRRRGSWLRPTLAVSVFVDLALLAVTLYLWGRARRLRSALNEAEGQRR